MWLVIITGLVVYLLFAQASLRNRISELEDQATKRSFSPNTSHRPAAEAGSFPADAPRAIQPDGNPISPIPTPSHGPSPLPVPPEPHYSPQIYARSPEEPTEFFLVSWFREQTLIKVGSIIFFLGAVWFVSYAIENNWISPLARIILGLLLALAIYAAGYLRKVAMPTQYQTLTTLGTGVFLGTVVASQFAFATPVLPATIAFVLMVLSITYTLAVALYSKAQWLAVAAAVAGLCVPLLVKSVEPNFVLLLTYLSLMTAGFLAVVFVTAWRGISLTLVFGIALYLLSLMDSALVTDATLWFFVIIFSALFYLSTTISVTRTDTPNLSDVVVLSLTTLQFIGYAIVIATWPELALFIVAALAAGVGYVLRLRGAGADSVSLYVAVSLVCSLVGTTLLFDGFVLTIVYALEALALFLLSLRLATVKRSVYVAASLFLLPLGSGIVDLSASVWNTGVFHPEALGTVAVLLTLGTAIVYILHQPALHSITWLRGVAGILSFGWYGFAVIATFVVANALRASVDPLFTQTLLLTTLALAVIVYTLLHVPYRSWNTSVLFTLFAPTITALTLLSQRAWSQGIQHELFWGALFFFSVLVFLAFVYWRESKVSTTDETFYGTISYGFVWAILGYGLLFLSTTWNALFVGDVFRVVTALSFVTLIYLIVNLLLLARFPIQQIILLLPVFTVPGLLLIPSLQFAGWSGGVMDINAVGLYATITILLLLATTLRQHAVESTEETGDLMRTASTTLYIISGLFAFCLVWIISHTVIASAAVAVSISLFLYTVAGLASYSYGRASGHSGWRRAGILLLTAVIIRLALVDIWNMEPVWRIVTFLGIGLLFIVTALLERAQHKSD
jgi:uncharacterized membrane protein